MDTCTWFLFLAGVGDVWVSEGGVWEEWACCSSTLTDLSALCPNCDESRWTHSHAHTCTLCPCLSKSSSISGISKGSRTTSSTSSQYQGQGSAGNNSELSGLSNSRTLKANSLWKIGSLVSLVPLMTHCQMLTFVGGCSSIHLDDLFLFLPHHCLVISRIYVYPIIFLNYQQHKFIKFAALCK